MSCKNIFYVPSLPPSYFVSYSSIVLSQFLSYFSVLQNLVEVIIFFDQVPYPCHGQGGNQFWRQEQDLSAEKKLLKYNFFGSSRHQQCSNVVRVTASMKGIIIILFNATISLHYQQGTCIKCIITISYHYQPDGRSVAKEGK